MVLNTIFAVIADIDSLLIFQPLVDKIQPILTNLSLFFGGIFGLYLIMTLSRIYYDRKNYLLLKDIHFNLEQLNKHYGLRYSESNRSLIEKILINIKHKFHLQKAQKEFASYGFRKRRK
ncbi:hypothetical protein HYX11_04045 [Candidatus Woesearchaeota archaeon]|nr:hypothetical protein [Candidatus Woesearchaeota archaeon]